MIFNKRYSLRLEEGLADMIACECDTDTYRPREVSLRRTRFPKRVLQPRALSRLLMHAARWPIAERSQLCSKNQFRIVIAENWVRTQNEF